MKLTLPNQNWDAIMVQLIREGKRHETSGGIPDFALAGLGLLGPVIWDGREGKEKLVHRAENDPSSVTRRGDGGLATLASRVGALSRVEIPHAPFSFAVEIAPGVELVVDAGTKAQAAELVRAAGGSVLSINGPV